MTEVLWAAMGVTVGSALLHGALGLRRPVNRIYLVFALIMVLLAAFLYGQQVFYRVTSVELAISATRRQLTVISAFMGCLLVFVPAYTRVRLPQPLLAAYWIGLAVVIVVNLCAPYTIWFSGPPGLAQVEFRGETYTTAVSPPMGLAQYAFSGFATSLLVVAIACGVIMYRRGERQRGATFAIAVGLVFVHGLIDIVRASVGGSWPYVAEYGVVSWGIIMSVQLAHDYRAQARVLADAIVHVEAQAARLTAILQSLRALEQHMTAPLDTLESGVAALGTGAATEDAQLSRLRRAVTRLREFARSMPFLGSATRAPAGR